MLRPSLFLPIVAAVVAGCSLVPAAGGGGDPLAGPPPPGRLRVAILDVGQGDSALVQAPGGASVLIDGGPPEAGPAVLAVLKRAKVERLTWVVGTHPHSDHIGGLLDVLKEKSPENALDPGYAHGTATQKAYLELLKTARTRVRKARAGQSYPLGDNAMLTVLAPAEPPISGTNSDANNNSIVCRIDFGETRALFTGDMENEERKRLLETAAPGELRAGLLKVAHHGSHNGTDDRFLEAVKPRFAAISCGKGNDYGHPHRQALADLEEARAQILRTDEAGTLVFESDGKRWRRVVAAAHSAGEWIGNVQTKTFHAASCKSLPSAVKRKTFPSRKAAEDAGYRAHRVCVK